MKAFAFLQMHEICESFSIDKLMFCPVLWAIAIPEVTIGRIYFLGCYLFIFSFLICPLILRFMAGKSICFPTVANELEILAQHLRILRALLYNQGCG